MSSIQPQLSPLTACEFTINKAIKVEKEISDNYQKCDILACEDL